MAPNKDKEVSNKASNKDKVSNKMNTVALNKDKANKDKEASNKALNKVSNKDKVSK